MIKCGLCGKEFEDGQFEEYAAHTNQCAAEMSMKKKTDEMKKIQAELEEVKRAKVCYEGLRDAFKEKYPDIYKINFPEETTSGSGIKVNADKSNNKKLDNTKITDESFNEFMKGLRDLYYFLYM